MEEEVAVEEMAKEVAMAMDKHHQWTDILNI